MAPSNTRRQKKEADQRFFLYVFFFHIFNAIGNFFTDLFKE